MGKPSAGFLRRPLTFRAVRESGLCCCPTTWLLGLAAFILYNMVYAVLWIPRRLSGRNEAPPDP